MGSDFGLAAQVATVLSPVVASMIFVVTIVVDRRSRRNERFAIALAVARSGLIRAGNWTVLPSPLHLVGGGAFRLFDQMSALGLVIPRRRYGELAIWLVKGSEVIVRSHESAVRLHAQETLLKALIKLDDGSRRGLKDALAFSSANPWPETALQQPPLLRWAVAIGKPVIWILSGDRTYGRSRSS